ncbi:MAG: peptidylprolyl isomerase [Nitrospiraceae bacterium]|nr:peptidylprolyl isomerase [Nitrospiraceae bacterium]
MKNALLILMVLGALLLPGMPQAAAGSVVIDRVVAVVNDEIITMSDLQREMTKKTDIKDEHLMLEDMIDRKLQMAAAKRNGMDVTDSELTDAVADIMKRNNLNSKQFEAALAKEGLTLEQYRTELREQMTMSRLFNKYVRSGIAIDEKEVREYYDRNPKLYALPEEMRVRHLVIMADEKATPAQVAAAEAKTKALLERVRKGEDFIQLIREYSESPTKAQDGDLGFLQRGHAIAAIEDAAKNLAPGEYAGPVRCEDGFHIIRLEEVRTPVQPYEKVKDEITKQLYEQKLENTYRSWLQTLRSDSHIENRL